MKLLFALHSPSVGWERGFKIQQVLFISEIALLNAEEEGSESGGRADVQHCSLHGEFPASEDRVGRCVWCF